MATSDDGAPTPSPIPTAKGVRSAANGFLSRYLEEKSVQVPDLVLPEVRVQAVGLIPEEIDLAVMDTEAVVRSAQQTGAVRVKGHGIGREEMKAVVRDAERIFVVSEETDMGFRQNILGGDHDREEIIWAAAGSQDHRMAWTPQHIGPQLYCSFSEKMEKLRSKIEATAEEMNRVFTDEKAAAGSNNKQVSGSRGSSVLRIYRHNNHNHNQDMMMMNNESRGDDDDHLPNLHLPTKRSEFRLHSGHHVL